MVQKKSQSAIEFILIIGFFILVFVTFIIILNSQTTDKIREKDTETLKQEVNNIEQEIMLASKAGDGYSRNFSISSNLNGKRYAINISDNMIYGRLLDAKLSMAVPIINVTGDVKLGINSIKKQNGKILLN